MGAWFAKTYITVIGVVLVVSGLLGFIENPIVGPDALLATDALHNIVHILTGGLALAIGFGRSGEALVRGVIGFGWLYIVLFVVLLLSPTLFGLLTIEVNVADHILHGGLGVLSLLIGMSARRVTGTTPASA
ncbi:MAG: DUF4383 domain-containing protein [Acidimicrobiia bacterium]